MRKAILYSGQLRTWNRCRNNQEEMIGEGDRYFFTTEKPSGEYKQFVQDFASPYYPNEMDLYASNKNPITKVHGALNQWHVNFVGFSLVPKDYDIFIRSRPDIELSDKIDFEKYEYRDDVVYIPEGNDHAGGFNDQFAFSNYNAMKKYFSVYLNHGELFARGLQFHTETYTTENLKMLGVEIVRIPQTNIIIREGDKTVYSKGSLKIAGEEPQFHWGMLSPKGKIVIDFGCGRAHQQSITTPEYFLKEGASKVVGVEMWDNERIWYKENVPEVTIYTDEIKTAEQIKTYLNVIQPQVVKMDIEGKEELLRDFEAQHFVTVEEMAVEYHSAEIRQMINHKYRDWGFVEITEFEMSLFDPQVSGVIHVKK